jgi:hypothetical protein
VAWCKPSGKQAPSRKSGIGTTAYPLFADY